ncbi:MAG: GTPase HflX [Rhodospirillales bacterium]|nr:GTPase HflX [Rhodospirillales bacterium]
MVHSITGQRPESVLLVHPAFVHAKQTDSNTPARTLTDQTGEAEGLVRAIGLNVLETRIIKLSRFSAGTFFGKGTIHSIAQFCEENQIDLAVVNHALSPVQQRNLEKEWKTKVIDRTGLILEIFGARAQTREGRIQVELAALDYQKSRLVRSWTHLERQRGGAGFMGGPGETQIEMDRRQITEKIVRLKKDLGDIRRTRGLARRSRERVPFPVVSLVGYTNAGKSTLFNRLTGAQVFAEDLPFATLDPTMRKLDLNGGLEVILSDTVGFIADLPTTLIEAFRATLEQVQVSDVILHIRDISRPDTQAQKDDVASILKELDIDEERDPRIIEVLNKIDSLDETDRAALWSRAEHNPKIIPVSALTGEGVDGLLARIAETIDRERKTHLFRIDPARGDIIAWLHAHAGIIHTKEEEDGHIRMEVRIDPATLGRLDRLFPGLLP